MADARKLAPVPADVEETLRRLVDRHVPGHPLEAAFPLPGGTRKKYLAKLEGIPERPLVLAIYREGEESRVERSVAASRALATRRAAPSYHVIAADARGESAPFRFRLATFIWGIDAGRLLEGGVLGEAEMREVGSALGEGLAGFHSVEAPGFGPVHLPAAERRSTLADEVLEMAAGVARGAFLEPVAEMVAALEGELEASGRAGRLVHGALSLGEAIVRKERGRYELTGFLGLDRASFFDPCFDLVCLEDALTRYPPVREAFLRAYGERRAIFAELAAKRPLMKALRSIERARVGTP